MTTVPRVEVQDQCHTCAAFMCRDKALCMGRLEGHLICQKKEGPERSCSQAITTSGYVYEFQAANAGRNL